MADKTNRRRKDGELRKSTTGGPGPRQVDQSNWRKRLDERRVKFDDERKGIFLDVFRQHNRMTEALEAAGVTRQTVMNHLDNDPDFAEAMQEARLAYRDRVHETLYHVAIEGVDEPIVGGKERDHIVGYTRKYYERTLLAEARRVDPDYKERSEVDMNHRGGVLVAPAEVSPEQFAAELEEHRRQRAQEVADQSG